RPFFPDPVGRRVYGLVEILHPLTDGLGVALQKAGDVLQAAVAEFEGLDGSIASAVLLREPVGALLHLLLDIFGIRVHVTLREEGLRTPSSLQRRADSGKLLRAMSLLRPDQGAPGAA